MVNNTFEEVDVEQEQDIFSSTPELVVPPNPPDAHRAVITSVEGVTLNNEKQSTKIQVNLVSRDVPTVDMRLDIWIPKAYLAVIGDPSFDPSTLAAEQGNNQQASYRMGIANSDKKATLQTLVSNKDSVARLAGRDPKELGLKAPAPGDFEGYVYNLNAMLQGVECIVTRKERGGEPPFNHQMEIKRILPADAFETTPKLFKNLQLAWENS